LIKKLTEKWQIKDGLITKTEKIQKQHLFYYLKQKLYFNLIPFTTFERIPVASPVYRFISVLTLGTIDFRLINALRYFSLRLTLGFLNNLLRLGVRPLFFSI
jgi:hypothetical protein